MTFIRITHISTFLLFDLGPSRLDKEGTKPVSRAPTSRKGRTKAGSHGVSTDDVWQKPAPKRPGRPPKVKVHLEVNEQMENTLTKEHAISKSKSKAKSKSMKAAATKSTAKMADRPNQKRSTKPTEGKSGVATANGDVASDQGRDPNRKGKSKGRGKAKASSAVETGFVHCLARHWQLIRFFTEGVSSMQRNKNEVAPDTNPSVLVPSKPCPRQSRLYVVKGAHLELSDNGEGLPIPFAADLPQRLGKGRKQAIIIKTVPVEDIDTDSTQEAEEPERAKPTSKKRVNRPEETDKDAEDGVHNRSVPSSWKRPKAARRNDSVPDKETTAVKINVSGKASEKLVKNSDQVTPLTDKPISKKRSREPGHVDSLVDPIIEKPRKRMKTLPARDKPMLATDREKVTDASSMIVDQGGENPRKT